MRKIIFFIALFLTFLYALPQPVLDLRMDECEWDNNPNTYEIKNYGSGGNDYNATAENGANTESNISAEGGICRVGDFDGKYVSLKTSFPLPDKYTATFWVKFPLKGVSNQIEVNEGWLLFTYKVYVIGSVEGTGDIGLFLENNYGDYQFGVYDNNGDIKYVDIPNLSNGWHFFAMKINNGKTKLYIDGDSTSYKVDTYTFGNLTIIGSSTDYSNRESIGNYMDEFKIFNKLLSQNNIKEIYNNEKNGKNYDGTIRNCVECPLKAIADYHLDECKWDNNPDTYEIKNYGIGGDEYNASSFGDASPDEGKVCRGGNFISDSDHDKALLPKNDIELPNEYTLNVWIKFPLNESGHKDFYGREYFNIADRPGQGYDGDYIYFSKENNKWYLKVADDNGPDEIDFNPQNLSGWHMITFVITDNGTKFYLDGDYNNSFSTHPTGEIGLLFNSDYQAGNNQPNWQSLGALADEFTIFDRALDSNEIKEIYNNENEGKNWDGTFRNCPSCQTQETNGTFNAVDYVASNCNALNDWDDNITTKIINKNFNLTILAKNKDLNIPLEANITRVDFYEYNTNDCSGSYNIENICKNCGQTSTGGCLTVSNIKISKAVKCIRVHIEGNVTNPVNPLQESNSTDTFAVRPDKFLITNISSKIIAGREFNLTLKALDYEGNPAKDYNESVNINGNSADLEYNISKSYCENGNLNIINGGNFKDGIATVTLKYNEVGDVNLTLKEVNGSEFALTDNDDTSLDNRLISSYKTQISIIPDHFKINANLENYDDNFTYLDSDLNLYSILDINITAENENNETTKNYNEDCYAKDIDINISKILSPMPNLENIDYYYKDAKNNDSDIFKQDIDQNIQIHYKDTNFTTDNNGSTHLTLFINFDRNISNPINPFDMNISEINVTDENGVNGTNNSVSGNALYYYGNLVLFDEMVNENEFNTRDNYFVIYDNNGSDDKLPSNNVIMPDWYLNIFHKNKDANISQSNIVVSSDYNSSDKISGVEVSVNSINNGKVTFHIKRTDTNVNFAVIHLLEPDLKWLWYSKYGYEYNISPDSTCLNHFCFTVTWENNEKGVIKSGIISGTESNTTENNATKRGVKIFR